MARQISEIQSLPFHQMIGGPLLAIVQGQAQAAQTTMEFIERVGFENPDGKSGLGSMRMVTFTYQKPDSSGAPREFKVSIPLLSLVPIPAIQVKEAEMEMSVKINDVQTSATSSQLYSTESEYGHWLDQNRHEFRGSWGPVQKKAEGTTSTDIQLNLKMKIEQADITAGLSALYRLMEQGISSHSLLPEESGTSPEEKAPATNEPLKEGSPLTPEEKEAK